VVQSGGWDAWLIGIDAAGNELWTRTYGGAQMEMISAAAVAPDGYIIAGYTSSSGAGDADMWLLKAGFATNQPPVANAGPDQNVEQTSAAGAPVVLNASASTDPDGDALTYSWSYTGGTASGVSPSVVLPPGVTTVTLTVSDGKAQSTDTVLITVRDTIAPEITVGQGVNPAGRATPAAESGFATLSAQDAVDAMPKLYIGTSAAPTMYGPFSSGISVKITVAAGAKAQLKQMGGANSAVSYHIILPDAAYVTARDAAGNVRTTPLP
jgi:hypothetical protein